MKSLIILLFAAGLFSSCQKKHCWECKYEIGYTGVEHNLTVCDKTQSEINKDEIMDCKKKK